MKRQKAFLFLGSLTLMMIPSVLKAQAFEQELVFHGPMKTMTLVTPDYSNENPNRKTVWEYDQGQRKIKEISAYNSNTEYYYPRKKDKKPLFKKWYRTEGAKEESFEVEQQDATGQTLLSGDLKGGNWNYYYIHDYKPTLHTIKWFTDGEIYLQKTEETIDLINFRIPAGFVPFEWDRKLSTGKIIKSQEYTADRYEHAVMFEFIEKGHPKNKITFHYNGSDVYDAGKGYWHRYEDDKKIEERYIYNASEISDFGHRYIYTSFGKLKSDHYGYFSKMPDQYIQRHLYTYNENGDCTKETEDAEGEKTSITLYKYTYDDHKNWTSRTSVYEDGSGSMIKRNFTYYKPGESELENSLSETTYNQYLKELQAYRPFAENQLKNYKIAKTKKENTPVDKTNYKTLRSANWKDFLPKGQIADSITKGDLNKDGIDDLVMVYQPEKLLKKENNAVRTLRILLMQNDGKYALAAESNGAIAGENINNTFFRDTEIKKGLLIINHDYIRGGLVHKYRYQNGGFYLIGAESTIGDSSYFSTIDYNLSTGKYIYIYENTDDDKQQPKSSKKEGVKKPSRLSNIETYELNTVDVEGFSL